MISFSKVALETKINVVFYANRQVYKQCNFFKKYLELLGHADFLNFYHTAFVRFNNAGWGLGSR